MSKPMRGLNSNAGSFSLADVEATLENELEDNPSIFTWDEEHEKDDEKIMSIGDVIDTSVDYDVTHMNVRRVFDQYASGDRISLDGMHDAFQVLAIEDWDKDEVLKVCGDTIDFDSFWHVVRATRMLELCSGKNQKDEAKITTVSISTQGHVIGPTQIHDQRKDFYYASQIAPQRLHWVDVQDYSPLTFERLSIKYCIEPQVITELLSGFSEAHPMIRCYNRQLLIVLPVPVLPQTAIEEDDDDKAAFLAMLEKRRRQFKKQEKKTTLNSLVSKMRSSVKVTSNGKRAKRKYRTSNNSSQEWTYAFLLLRGNNTVISVNNRLDWNDFKNDLKQPSSRLRNQGPLYLIFTLMENAVRQCQILLKMDEALVKSYEDQLEMNHILTLTTWNTDVDMALRPIEKLKRLLRYVSGMIDSLIDPKTYRNLRHDQDLYTQTPTLHGAEDCADFKSNTSAYTAASQFFAKGASPDSPFSFLSTEGETDTAFRQMFDENSSSMRMFCDNLCSLRQQVNEISEDVDDRLQHLGNMQLRYDRLKGDEQAQASFFTSIALFCFFPLQFITGWFGMNFFTPEQGCNFEDSSQCSGFSQGLSNLSFYIVVGSVCVVTIGMALYFKFVRHWL